jgi:hypothetical protein
LAVGIAVALAAAGRRAGNLDGPITTVFLAAMAVYLFLACRRVYGGGVVVTALRAGALLYVVMPVLQYYRALLFFVTLRTLP